MRRVTSSWSESLNSAGAVRALFSMNNVTSAVLRGGRSCEPAKITSSMAAPRMLLYEVSPIAQRSASSRFDLPQPLGPTTPVKPGSTRSSVGSTKDLKPRRRSRVIFTCQRPSGVGYSFTRQTVNAAFTLVTSKGGNPATTHPLVQDDEDCGGGACSIMDLISSKVTSPCALRPLMKKVGVPITPNWRPRCFASVKPEIMV